MSSSVLVVCAHPDDEVLGCAGTLLTLGKKVGTYLLVMSDGESSRKDGDIKKREGRCVHIATRLFSERPTFVGMPDNRMDVFPLIEAVKSVELAIDRIKPTTIFTHYEHDLNVDHRITYQATITACRPFKYPYVKQIYSFEVPSSTEIASVPFKPDTFVDITHVLARKQELFTMYDEMNEARNGRVIESLACYRGTQAGCLYAEAFKTVRRCGISVP